MSFDAPTLLWIAPGLGLFALGLAALARAARVRHARRWSADLGARAKRVGRFGAALLGLSVMLAVGALAGPRWGSRVVTAESKSLNVVIAVDI
ncbi:MAG: hypothetical protein PVH40_07360, partial [Gemmatimonadales bacterium]